MTEIAALLAAALLFGGMTLYSFGLAPLLFTGLDAPTAGRMLRRAFPWYYLFILATAVLAAGLLAPSDPVAAGLMAATATVAIIARQALMPAINAATDAGAERRFAWLHGLSVALNFVQLAAVAWVLVRFL
ncbi:MAG: DUF4149 domain-containing protein [Rhodobacter sp.]|nr:DUF4149 domain-containing protein [Rhodobacter sp.]